MSWLDIYILSLIFSVCSFQGTLLTDFSSVIRNLNIFKSLITGETSYQNSTSLLIGLALISCCSSLPVFILTSAADLPLSFSFKFGGHLLSHTVSSAVPSAVWVLTIVFGMGTGVTPRRIATKKAWVLSEVFSSLELSLFAALGEVLSNLVRRTSSVRMLFPRLDNPTIDNSSLLLLPF